MVKNLSGLQIHETSKDGPVDAKLKHRMTVWLKEGVGQEQTKSIVEIYEWPVRISKVTGLEMRSSTPEAILLHYRSMWGSSAVFQYEMVESDR